MTTIRMMITTSDCGGTGMVIIMMMTTMPGAIDRDGHADGDDGGGCGNDGRDLPVVEISEYVPQSLQQALGTC